MKKYNWLVRITAALGIVVLMILNGFHMINSWVYSILFAAIVIIFFLFMSKSNK